MTRHLLRHQVEGIDWLIHTWRSILGDDRGLGKTVQALKALDASGSFPAVVIVPPGHVRTNWAREVRLWTPNRSVHVAEGGRPTMLKADITVIGYSEAHKWAPLLPHGIRGFVLDEAHRIRNATARQSQAVMAISAKVADDGMMIALTGTLAPNGRNGEVVRILRAIRRLGEFGGVAGVMGMSGTELHDRLTATCYLRRLKDDSLPSRWWSPVYVQHLQQAEMHAHEEMARKISAAGPNRAGLTSLLGLLAARKTSPAVDWIREFLEDTDRKLVVFGTRRALISEIAGHYGDLRVQGGQTMAERTEAIDRFQGDPAARVISVNMAAGGEGITLTAASDALFVEQEWTPGAMDQCLDRLHRIGQDHSVVGWVMLVPDTIDEDMHELIEAKRADMDAIQDGTASGSGNWSVEEALARRLADRYRCN